MDPTRQTLNLFITYVDKEGPFLKVWGQAEKNNSIYVEQFLHGASPSFNTGIGKIPFETLQVGTLVCAKYKDEKYYRARINSIDYLNDSFVEVNFVDYGNKDIVPSDNIRSLQNFPTSFISIPPLATGFIFAEAHCPGGGEWKDQIFEVISKELRYREVQCHLLTQATQYYLIRLFIENTDIGALFISRGLMQPIPLHAQQAVLLSMSMQRKAPTPPAQAAPPAEINTFKACTLEPNQQYAVYVSFVNEGPTHFSVQLQQSEHMLAKLMKEINEINLRMLEDVPLPGTICLARCQEDGHICRAVVTNEVDNQFKVFYVDFGNYETLPLEFLYQIPFKYVLPKVMAIRLALNGVEKPSVTLEMLLAFKKFVDNRLLYMKVLPSSKKIVIPKCELWDPVTKTSALDVINRAAQHAYPEPLLLNRGFTQPIRISYVFSCNRFYVQLISKEQELARLMDDLQISCQSSDSIDDIKIGLPCCALYEVDQLWYRSEIVDVVDKENVKVRYIDYGNEEVVPVAHLRMVEGELLTVLRPQAIECCLNGYQNMGPDETRDNLLEELILEQNFTMKVSEMLGKKALVELIDSNNYNVASLLLDKIAAAQSQVSPMLVQAGNKIEHRKSSQGDFSDNFRGQRKPAREQKDWNRNDRGDGRNSDKTNERSWRSENKDFRQNDVNSNDGSSDNGSWRQNNKGFNKHNDRNDRSDRSQRDDRPNVNERFNKHKPDRDNDNWKKKDSGQANDVWSSPANDAPPPATGDVWETPSPVQRDEDPKPRFDRGDRSFGGNRGGGRGGRGDRSFREDRGDRGDRGGFKKDGFKKDFRQDGGEMSSSGSEKSFNKGPRTSSRNDHGGSKFQNRSNNSFGNMTVNDSWSVSDVSTPIDAAPRTATFDQLDVVGTEGSVTISWFHNPEHFYCQLQSTQTEFKALMEEIQQFYKNRKPETCVAGSPVVGLFPEDNVLYRAQVLEVLGREFKVFYVDFGNVSTITKVWPIEKKFMNVPAQAICCSLVGIGPNNDSWPDSSTFKRCFQKEWYMARFLEKDEKRAYMQLWDDQEEMSQILCREALALPIAEETSGDVEVALLLNQQFRIVLKSVNNLSDVIVALQCGLAVNCKAHNVEMASEFYEDVLKAHLEETLIVYVDNVLENNVLDVTFYDNDGNKLVILNPDEGALDNVEPLCPLLIISSTLYGYISYADETSIFIQPSEYAEQIPTLLDRMFEVYENMTEETSIIPEEGLVYAVHSEDGNWYRGRVTSFDDDTAAVFYVDYGNSESVGFSAIRELENEFNVPNIMCLQVTVVNGTALSFLEKDVKVSIYYGETGWEGTVEECATSGVIEELPASVSEVISVPQEVSEEPLPQDGTLVQDTLQEQEFSQEVAQEAEVVYVQEVVAADQHAAAAAETSPVADQKGTPVLVCHIDSPTEFYLQFAESAMALEELQQILQDTAEEMPVLENISVGVLCAAPFSLDQQWYRAEVLDADDDITTVRFVDYGNTDVINNMNTQIKTLPPHLLTPAVYSTRCSLKLKAIQDEWSQQALELFESLASQENVVAEFIVQDEKTNIVELHVNAQNIKDALLEQGLAVPCEIVTETKSTCFVSHLNSPSEFWVQMENCVDELEWIAEQLSGAEKYPELEDTTPGTLCAALFPDDDMWYRARILSNTIAGIELLFIDYGNSCVSSSLRQLPEDLVVTSPLAQKCCLQRPEGIPYWTKEAQDKFAEISAEGQTIFEMKKITSGETATVELLLHGENVVNKILPVTEEGCVKKFETLDRFSIEKSGEILSESFSLEPMPGMEWDEDSHKKFLELYPEGTLFEIEVISEDIVRLYQNGADIRPNLGGVKSSLNLSNTEEEKTENIDVSEEDVIDHEAGGDTLRTRHSNEDITQETAYTNESEQELAVTETNQICDKGDISAETDLQDSGNVDVSNEQVAAAAKDKSSTLESETDSGHHSDHEVPKEEEKLAEDEASSKEEEVTTSDSSEKDEAIEASGDKSELAEESAVASSESSLTATQEESDSKIEDFSNGTDSRLDTGKPQEEPEGIKERTLQASPEKEEKEPSEQQTEIKEPEADKATDKPQEESKDIQENTPQEKLAEDVASSKKEEVTTSDSSEKDEAIEASGDKSELGEESAAVSSESSLTATQEKSDSKTDASSNSTDSRLDDAPCESPKEVKEAEAIKASNQQQEESEDTQEEAPQASPEKEEAQPREQKEMKEQEAVKANDAPCESPKEVKEADAVRASDQGQEKSEETKEKTPQASPKKGKEQPREQKEMKEQEAVKADDAPCESPKEVKEADAIKASDQQEEPEETKEKTPQASPKKEEEKPIEQKEMKEQEAVKADDAPCESPKEVKEADAIKASDQQEEPEETKEKTPQASPKKEEEKPIEQKEMKEQEAVKANDAPCESPKEVIEADAIRASDQQQDEPEEIKEKTPQASPKKEEEKQKEIKEHEAVKAVDTQQEESKGTKENTPQASPKKDEKRPSEQKEIKESEADKATDKSPEESEEIKEKTPEASPKKEEEKPREQKEMKEQEAVKAFKPQEESEEIKEKTPEASPKKEEKRPIEQKEIKESEADKAIDKPQEESEEIKEKTPEASPKKEEKKPSQQPEIKKPEVVKEDEAKEESKDTKEATPKTSPKKSEQKEVKKPAVAKTTDKPKEGSKETKAVSSKTSPRKEDKKSEQKEVRKVGVAKATFKPTDETKETKEVTPKTSPKKEEKKLSEQKQVRKATFKPKEESKETKEMAPKTSLKKEEKKPSEQKQVRKATFKPKEESKGTKEVAPKTSPKKEEPKPSEQEEESHSRPSSREGRRISHDDKILPAVYSAPHSPLPDEPDTASGQKEDGPYSRPSSAEGRIKHDDRIVPAVLSRPQTPIPDESASN